jgi:GNAT superfamily N-acetyltransferase
VAFTWSISEDASTQDLAVVAEGVFAYGRAQARDSDAKPISCLVREGTRIVAGGSGRTEYGRLYVGYLWVTEALRGNGIGSRVLLELEAEAAKRGCRDALIETLEESVAQLYARLGYEQVAYIPSYVGSFNRHFMLKTTLVA